MTIQPEPSPPASDKQTPWWQEIRAIHDGHFEKDWQPHIDAINQDYALVGAHKLFTADPGAPMPWFNGNIEAVEPGHWVLVISLNHYVDPDSRSDGDGAIRAAHTPDAYWDHRCTFNTTHWYRRFFGPLARVAASALGEQLTKEQEPDFATNRMIFVDICPYGSQQFNLSWQTVEALLTSDPGFRLAAQVNRLLIEKGRPALVMVNGVGSINMLAHVHTDALSWQRLRYLSCDLHRDRRKPKQLWHFCGSLNVGESTVPVVGFPFLKKPRTHNSNAELAQLSEYVRHCVENGG